MSWKCIYCSHCFNEERSLLQHLKAKHFRKQVLLDENLSESDEAIKRLRSMKHVAVTLPEYMLGHPDHDVINFAKQKQLGLATCDRECAEKAVDILSPVYLVSFHGTSMEINKI
ncbi:MAG: DUF5615 family PIN-like protein [Candidatus Hodarchaeota archaeon]